MSLKPQRHVFTEHEYKRMGEAGILPSDQRLELIEGEIVEMGPIGELHAACVKRINAFLAQQASGQAIVSIQDPLRLDDLSEPQPDVMLLRPRADFYSSRHPGPADVILLIEVSDASLQYDRAVKARLYAMHAIRELWIVDLGSEAIEVYSEPGQEKYGRAIVYQRGENIGSEAMTSLLVPVDTVLG